MEYLESALQFYLSTHSLVVKCSSRHFKILGPLFDFWPSRMHFEISVLIDVSQALLVFYVTTAEMDGLAIKSSKKQT